MIWKKKKKSLLEINNKLEPPPPANSRRNSQNTATADTERSSLPSNATAEAVISGAYYIGESFHDNDNSINTIYQYQESFWVQEQQRQQNGQQQNQPDSTYTTTANLGRDIGYDNDIMKGKQENFFNWSDCCCCRYCWYYNSKDILLSSTSISLFLPLYFNW